MNLKMFSPCVAVIAISAALLNPLQALGQDTPIPANQFQSVLASIESTYDAHPLDHCVIGHLKFNVSTYSLDGVIGDIRLAVQRDEGQAASSVQPSQPSAVENSNIWGRWVIMTFPQSGQECELPNGVCQDVVKEVITVNESSDGKDIKSLKWQRFVKSENSSVIKNDYSANCQRN